MNIRTALPRAESQNMDELRASADMITEVSDRVTFLGFCLPGTTGTNAPGWSILVIEQSNTPGSYPNTTSFKWALGMCAYNLIFDNYLTYSYEFKNF